MSSIGLAFVPGAYDSGERSPVRPIKWWERFGMRCAGMNCPHSERLWPSRLHSSSGVVYEGRWYCEAHCAKPALERHVQELLSSFNREKTRNYRLPLGLLLINRGVISHEQLREAIRLQREAGSGRIGSWLSQMGLLSEQQLTASLAQQWGCPVFPANNLSNLQIWHDLLPLTLLESARAFPAHISGDGRVVHLAFGERLDHTLLYAVEKMLDCRTFACVLPESTISALLDEMRGRSEKTEACFDTMRDPREMAGTVCNYAVELQANRLAVARGTAHVWARFYRKNATRDLLFRILPGDSTITASEKDSGWTKVFSISADSDKHGATDAIGLS